MSMSRYSSGGHGGEKEEEPEIYLQFVNDAKHYWACLDRDGEVYGQICGCGGAKVQLGQLHGQPECHPMQSSYTVFGSRIYLFGGYDTMTRKEVSQVAYIDLKCPEQGWKTCNNSMLKPQTPGYTFTYDDDRVVILGSSDDSRFSPDFIQVYYPHTDHWVDLTVGMGVGAPPYPVSGHAVVDNGSGKRLVLAHCNNPALYSFDVDANRWDYHWEEGFAASAGSAALVDGIYYVINFNMSLDPDLAYFFGYDIALNTPKCLPVEILPKKYGQMEDDEWIPSEDCFGGRAGSTLMSLGNSKLAMTWHYTCLENSGLSSDMSVIFCSKFKMIKSVDDSGGLKLLAQPLSKVSYHVDGYYVNDFLSVYPNKNMDFIAAKKRKIEEEETAD